MRKSLIAASAFILIPALLAGCSSKTGSKTDTANPAPTQNQDPVTLVFASDLGKTPDDFQKEVGDPVHKKFPWITATYIERGNGKNIEDLVAAGSVPDIYSYVYNRFPTKIQKLGLDFDMSELIKKNSYDLKHIDPVAMKALDQFTGGKGVYGLPFVESVSTLYYNKGLFDKFGVAYPKDGMTWDETYDLAKKLTRAEGGVQYRGFASFYSYILRENPYGLLPLDPATGKASLNTDQWKKVYENLLRFYQIPGNNRTANPRTSNAESQAFFTGQNVAMTVQSNTDLGYIKSFPAGMDWDVVSVPTYADKPKLADQPSPTIYSITKTSQHKDAAYLVLSYLTSDEYFAQMSKMGFRTPTTNDQIRKSFGSDSPLLKGKNIGAYYYYPAATPPSSTASDSKAMGSLMDADGVIGDEFTSMILDGVDINTALRDGDDKINKLLANQK